MSRKGAKGRTHGRKLRSTRTKETARVGRTRELRTGLEEKLEAHARELQNNRELNEARKHLAEALEQQTARMAADVMVECEPVTGSVFTLRPPGGAG